MKKIMLGVVVLMMVATGVNAQSKKKVTYKQTDIEGIWLVTDAFDENTKQWVPCGGDDAQAWGFMSETSHGKPLVLLSNDGGVTTFTYTIKGNKILLCDVADDTLVLVTIKIVSLKRGHSFVGLVSTFSSPYRAKFKFTKIDEKE